MDHSQQYFEARAAQCRRLAMAQTDRRMIEQLTAMALEFDAQARRMAERLDRGGAPEEPGA